MVDLKNMSQEEIARRRSAAYEGQVEVARVAAGRLDELGVLQKAQLEARAAAMAVYERDGNVDRGTCGGAILLLKGNTKLAKIAVANGFAWNGSGDIYVQRDYGAEIASQNMDIPEAFMEAFKRVLEENGYGFAIKKYWSYVD